MHAVHIDYDNRRESGAEAAYLARSEIVPQTRAGLLPSIVVSGSYTDESRSYPGVPEEVAPSSSFPTERVTVSKSQHRGGTAGCQTRVLRVSMRLKHSR